MLANILHSCNLALDLEPRIDREWNSEDAFCDCTRSLLFGSDEVQFIPHAFMKEGHSKISGVNTAKWQKWLGVSLDIFDLRLNRPPS